MTIVTLTFVGAKAWEQLMHKNPSFRQVMVHTAMGAVLGALLALALIVTDSHLFELIAHFPSPGFPLVLLIGVSSFLIAAGATLTGLLFTTIEINSPPRVGS